MYVGLRKLMSKLESRHPDEVSSIITVRRFLSRSDKGHVMLSYSSGYIALPNRHEIGLCNKSSTDKNTLTLSTMEPKYN